MALLFSACSGNSAPASDSNANRAGGQQTANNGGEQNKTANKETEGEKPTQTSSSGGTEAELPKEVRIGFQVIPNAELLAKTLGLVEKKFPDVKINWVQFDSGRDVNTAIASGGIDLGLAGSVPVAIGIANKLEYQVYFLHDIIGDNEALAVKEAAGVKDVSGLKGKKVAAPFGSTTHFSLLSALKEAGLEASDVKVLDLQPPDILAAWQRGDIDAAFVWQPTLAKLIENKGTILTTAKKLAEKGIITADVGVVSTAFANKYPQFLKQYVGVLDEAIAFYRSEPEKAAQSIGDFINQSAQDSLAQMNELVWLTSEEQRSEQYLGNGVGSVFAKVLKETGDFLVTQQSIPSAPDLAAFEAGIRTDALQP
ncbi:ABC transporter substrate-binding protein [Paenibacillus sp. MAHUQ-46]|uniref:ABC transporter substrate-binding protein n=2 Tax=Paenibacillus TaxID=44249 RepID=A0A934J7P2_9BACL|nr:ABC transporter substrate-binding protein [Paenibacillus roseus]